MTKSELIQSLAALANKISWKHCIILIFTDGYLFTGGMGHNNKSD